MMDEKGEYAFAAEQLAASQGRIARCLASRLWDDMLCRFMSKTELPFDRRPAE